MSLFSTIAHDRPVSMRKSGLNSKRLLAMAACAVAIAVAAVSGSLTTEVTGSTERLAPGELTNAQFIELNTVALDAAIASKPVVDANSFIYWNIDALEGYTPQVAANQVNGDTDQFRYWNIESLDYTTQVPFVSSTGPR